MHVDLPKSIAVLYKRSVSVQVMARITKLIDEAVERSVEKQRASERNSSACENGLIDTASRTVDSGHEAGGTDEGSSAGIGSSQHASRANSPNRKPLPLKEVEKLTKQYIEKYKHQNINITIRLLSKHIGASIGSIQKTRAWNDLMAERDAASPPERSVRAGCMTRLVEQTKADPRASDPAEVVAERDVWEARLFDKISPNERAHYHSAAEVTKDEWILAFKEQEEELERESRSRS
jgi:hypothetical protein